MSWSETKSTNIPGARIQACPAGSKPPALFRNSFQDSWRIARSNDQMGSWVSLFQRPYNPILGMLPSSKHTKKHT